MWDVTVNNPNMRKNVEWIIHPQEFLYFTAADRIIIALT